MSKYIKVDDLQRYCDNQKDHSITPNEFQRMTQYEFGWHTGTPTEDGYYLCHIQFYSEDYESDEEGYDITYEFKNGSWEEDDENVRIIAWQKIDHYKEKEK